MDIFRWEVQKVISDETGIPLEKIYGVATFYSQFTLNPKRKIPDFCLSWHGLLCQGVGRYLQCTDGKARHCRRRMYA